MSSGRWDWLTIRDTPAEIRLSIGEAFALYQMMPAFRFAAEEMGAASNRGAEIRAEAIAILVEFKMRLRDVLVAAGAPEEVISTVEEAFADPIIGQWS